MKVLFVYPNIGGFRYDNCHFGLASLVSGLNILYPYRGTELGDKGFADDMVDMMYYYENWQMLVEPWNVKLRMIWLAKKFNVHAQARTAYRAFMAPFRYAHTASLGFVRPGPSA